MKEIRKINEAVLPSDEEFESKRLPVMWICAQERDLDNIFKSGFDRAYVGKNGTMFGEGVYSSYYLSGAKRLLSSGYGNTIVKAKLPYSYKGAFLIYTETEAKIWYGDKWQIEDQLRCFTNDENLIHSLKNLSPYDLGRHYQGLAKKAGVRGIIYDWHNHGSMARGGRDYGHVCVLPFDFKSVIPYAVSYDYGNTFEKKFDNKIRKNFEEMVDPVFLLKNRYEKNQIGRPVYVSDYGFNFVPIRKGWGQRWNLVELGSKEMHEVSPIDFDSITKPNSKTGVFQIEYNGKFYNAIPWIEEYKMGAFEETPDNWSTFDELKNLNINESIIKENEEEKRYKGFRIPSKEQIYSAISDPNNLKRENRGAFYAYTTVPSSAVEGIFKFGFRREFSGTNDEKYSGNANSWYGPGVYCNIGYELGKWQLNRGKYGAEKGSNGGIMIQVAIIGGLNRFLIFNEKYARLVYGSDYSIKSQIYRLCSKEDADSLWRDIEDIMRYNSDAREEHHFSNERSTGLLKKLLYPGVTSMESVIRHLKLFSKNNIRGAVYTGGADKLCLVAYDYSSVMPIAFYNPSKGKLETSGNIVLPNGQTTEKKVSFNYNDSVNRMFIAKDLKQTLGHKFKDFDSASIKGVDINGNETSYKKVTTFSNEFNYIDTNTEEKISEIDFSYATLMNPSQDNSFHFGISQNTLSKLGIKNIDKVSEIDFLAIPYAYLDPLEGEDGWHTFDDLKTTLSNIDINIENQKGEHDKDN